MAAEDDIRPSDRVTHPLYQRGIRAALQSPGAYWRTISDNYNTACANGDLSIAFNDAMDTASFDLIAVKDGQSAGLVSIGASYNLAYGLFVRLGAEGQHQIRPPASPPLHVNIGRPKATSDTRRLRTLTPTPVQVRPATDFEDSDKNVGRPAARARVTRLVTRALR